MLNFDVLSISALLLSNKGPRNYVWGFRLVIMIKKIERFVFLVDKEAAYLIVHQTRFAAQWTHSLQSGHTLPKRHNRQ